MEDKAGFRASLLDGLTLTAPAMIVTIYGDIVVPRGDVLWMGSLIGICAQFGITETQVRTAVSRLVNAGRLVGIRDGRRSYYQLADSARDEFDLAARLLFEPIPPADGWTILHARETAPETLRRAHFAALGNGVFIRPNHAHLGAVPPGIVFSAALSEGATDMLELAHSLWPLADYAAEYLSFIDRFSPLIEALRRGDYPAGQDAVFMRLLLVHLYRHVLLADPMLPAEVLPCEWPGTEARELFASAYLALSEQTDTEIGRLFEGRNAPLPTVTEATARRLQGVRVMAGLPIQT
ncbi:PaaX family transcriptional regulator [Allorhizobium sp. BGMRC 0089]|uniref:PaaX family transcriptional regulator C-terminal domain-containing protein n=1 Tax=Allorhizobium sonneratiae TaxID=2934936 RepID=UPI0020333C1A|nr:PaaX family transcriptional regulator C-terminal domain-containing protein [Allorhizobium sonneratiae]MCM2293930.1 PaaX family transcriptional regulator [Allorhizobium sonneratiae]